MEYIKNAENFVKGNLDNLLANPYIMAVLKVTLALYAIQLAPRLPPVVTNVFQNTLVKFIAVVLISYLANVDFQLSILLAILFVLGGNLASGRKLWESFSNMNLFEDLGPYFTDETKYKTLLNTPAQLNNFTLLDSSSDNYSGCDNIKLKDLLDVFDGDHMKLQKTTQFIYRELMNKLPENSDAKTRLLSIARVAGLPYNMQLTDENAGYIATILVNGGFQINKICAPPSGDDMINM
jgi:hypothetical protein